GAVARAGLRGEVIKRLEQARRNLPEGCKQEDVVLLPDMEDGFHVVAVWSDGRYDLAWLTRYVATRVEPEMARLSGVARVTMVGGAGPKVGLTPDMERLAADKLTVSDVVAALRKEAALREDKEKNKQQLGQAESLVELKATVIKSHKD